MFKMALGQEIAEPAVNPPLLQPAGTSTDTSPAAEHAKSGLVEGYRGALIVFSAFPPFQYPYLIGSSSRHC